MNVPVGLSPPATVVSGTLGYFASSALKSPVAATIALTFSMLGLILGAVLVTNPSIVGHAALATCAFFIAALSAVLDFIGLVSGGAALIGVFAVVLIMDGLAAFLTAYSQGWA